MPDLTGLSSLLKSLYAMEANVNHLEQDFSRLRTDVTALQLDHAALWTRMAVLEESRKTILAEVDARVTERLAELSIRFAEAQASGRSTPPLSPGKETTR